MLNTIKILMILLVFSLLMPFGTTLSYGYQEYSGAHSGGHSAGHFTGHSGVYSGGHGYRGSGGRGYANIGLAFNYSPYYYNPYYYPDYYDTGVIVSSPVVETPEITVQPSTTVVTTAPTYPTTEITPVQITATDADNEISINIPNSKGGYTSVLIKRSGKGFVGPQGEYYPVFPRVSVLKVMYAR